MQRTLLIVPGLIDPTGENSLVGPSLRPFEEHARVVRAQSLQTDTSQELAWLGVIPQGHAVPEGVLLVAALGASPPRSAICFRVDLLSIDSEGRIHLAGPISEAEGRQLGDALERLNTRALTLVAGPSGEHGLVWEPRNSFHMQCQEPQSCLGKPMGKQLPEGEGEQELRRFIDDSVNLLSELELNRRRLDEGLSPINLAWPWGNGMPVELPNLSLRLMEPVTFFGTTLRMKGLCRLLGIRFVESKLGFKTHWTEWRDLPNLAILHTSAFQEAREANRLEVAEELWMQIVADWLTPLATRAQSPEDEPRRITILAPNAARLGLAWELNSHNWQANGVPFHEKVLGDSKVPTVLTWHIAQQSLLPS